MRLLAIETSSPRLSLAAATENRVLKEFQGPLAWRHAESLFDGMKKVLAQARWPVQSLTGICVSIGPGSFTGIRIGLAAARALGQSLNVPVAGISSLQAIAWGSLKPGLTVCPLIDALRGDVFTALYQITAQGELKTLVSDTREPFKDWLEHLKGWRNEQLIFAGDGALLYKDTLLADRSKSWSIAAGGQNFPRAKALIELGRPRLSHPALSYQQVLPLYLRAPAAVERRNA